MEFIDAHHVSQLYKTAIPKHDQDGFLCAGTITQHIHNLLLCVFYIAKCWDTEKISQEIETGKNSPYITLHEHECLWDEYTIQLKGLPLIPVI